MSETGDPPENSQAPAASETQSAEQVPSKPGRWRWLRVALKVFFLTFLMLLLLGVWVLGTQSGLRFALAVVEGLAPDLLEVKQVDGRVLGDLHVKGMQVHTAAMDLDLGGFDLRWSPLGALTGMLHIAEISARDLDLVVAPAEDEEEKPPLELPKIVLPFGIELEKVLVERFSFGAPGDVPAFRVDRAAMAASATGSELTISELEVSLSEPRVNASARGRAELTGDYALELDLRWDLSQEPALKLNGEAEIAGDLRRLRLTHDLTGSAQAKLDALVQEILDGPRWEGKLEILSVDLPSIRADLPAADLTGRLTTRGDLSNARVQGGLTGEAPDLPDFGRLNVVLDITWADQVLDILALELTEDKSGALLTADGRLDLSDPAGGFNLVAAWEKLRWPLTGELIAEARQGKIDIGGTFDQFKYSASADVWGTAFPEIVLQLTGKGDREATRIENLRLDSLGGSLVATADVGWADAVTWAAEADIKDINPGEQWPEWGGALGGRILSEGTVDEAGPELSAELASLKGMLRGYPVHAAALVRVKGKDVQVERLALSSGPSNLKADGIIGEELDLRFALDSPDLRSLLPEASGSLEASGSASGPVTEPAVKLELAANEVEIAGNSIQVVSGNANLDLAQGGLMKIDLAGKGMLVGGIAFDLKLASEGTPDAFEYGLEGVLTGEALPESTLRLNGEGDIKGGQARIDTLRLDSLGGYLEATADVGWTPIPILNAEIEIADVNPGQQWPEWAGALAGRILIAGSLPAEGIDLSAELESLKGELRGYPVEAAAMVRVKGSEVQVEQLQLSSGPSNLKADGTIGDVLDIRFALDSPDLRSLLPEASGSIKASGTASGPLKQPAVKLEVAAKRVNVAGNGIEDLSGNANVDLAQGGLMKIDLSGKGLLAGGMIFDSLRIQGDGDMASHRLTAKIQGEPLSLDLKAAGGLKEGNVYAGQLSGLELRTKDFSNWRLQKAAPVTMDLPRLSAGPLCIREDAGSGGCIHFERPEAGSWTAGLNLDRLSFALFKDFIPEALTLEGEASAKGSFKVADGVLTGVADLQVPKGVLSAKSGSERIDLINFSSANLGLSFGGKGMQAKLAVPLTPLGDLSGDLSLPGWSLANPGNPGQAISGGVRARIHDLGVIASFVPDVTNLTGNLDADFKLGGTFSKPGVSGSARLANGGLEMPFIGLKVEDLALSADARSPDLIEYSGGLKAGKNRLAIGGQSRRAQEGFDTIISAKGDKLTLADSKEYFLLASLDLQVELEPTSAKVTGKVVIPEARIRPRTIPAGSVTPSSDVVLAETEEKPFFAQILDLRLVLGKKVTVSAFGLAGAIEGDLEVLQEPGGEILGKGKLKIVEGTYRISTGGKITAAIGKPLDVDPGFLNYSDSPIDNPFMVLTAKREGRETSAGLRVFGTLKEPKLTFFSATDPGMSQSEVATYLVTGVPPRSSGQDPADRALSVGTYVTDKLFAEYDYSLGDESDKIKLRYDLNDWIELQTETGDSQGGDIFLKIEN